MEGSKDKSEIKRGNVVPKVFVAIIFITGLLIFLYPVISSAINERTQSSVVEKYQTNAGKISPEDLKRIKEEAENYNEILKGGTVIVDPFSEDKTQEIGSGYTDLLNVGETMGYVEIPQIDVNLPIYHGTSDLVLQKGVGHIENTSLPIGGVGAHTVLTGHRGLPSSILFRYLNELVLGDVFYIHVLDEVHAYQVRDIRIVEPFAVDRLKIVAGEDLVTLVTCDPYMLNYNRLLVQGIRIPYVKEDATAEPAAETNVEPVVQNPTVEAVAEGANYGTTSTGWLMVSMPVAAALGVVGYVVLKRKRKDNLSGDKK